MGIKVIVLIITISFFPHYAIGNDRSSLAKENQLLKNEWLLAQTPNLYVIFHLREKTIQIKAKGVTLREFPIHDIHIWGKNLPGSALSLVKKSALVKPARAVIRPGDMKESEDVNLDVLELEDMPARYTLVLDNRISIAIRPSEGVSSQFGNMLASLKNFILRPAITFWYAVRGKQYTALDIKLEKQDAKALYWSFPEGTKSIVYPPL